MGHRDEACDRETKPRARLAAWPGAPGAVIALKNVGQVLGINAWAGITDAEDGPLLLPVFRFLLYWIRSAVGVCQLQDDLASRRGIGEGIVHQIE